MSFSNADFFNAIVGMTFDNRGRWPSCLYEHGYKVTLIEPTIRVNSAVVNPEVLMCSHALRSALSFEWKSGANTKADQNARNAQLDGKGVASFLANEHMPLAYQPTHAYVYACDDSYYSRIAKDLDANGYPFPVLSFTPEQVYLRRGKFDRSETQATFRPGLKARIKEAPRLIKFDFTSDDKTIALELLQQVQLRMTRERIFPEDPEEVAVTIDAILQDINPYLHSNLASDKKSELCNRLKRMFSVMARQEFRKYVRLSGDSVVIKTDCYNHVEFQIRAINFLNELQAA